MMISILVVIVIQVLSLFNCEQLKQTHTHTHIEHKEFNHCTIQYHDMRIIKNSIQSKVKKYWLNDQMTYGWIWSS